MAKISINLLPPEIMALELREAKFYKVQFVGIVIVMVMIFLASLTVALRVLQSKNLEAVQASLAQEEQAILGLKDTQAHLLLLKNRLGVINQYYGKTSEANELYTLLDKLIPNSITVNAVTINKNGEIMISVTAPDTLILDDLITNLINPNKNKGKINQVFVDSLNRGRDGYYRVGIKIKP